MQYRPEIDGLRAIAVGTVILFHAGFSGFSGGFVGVDIFFVLSGYLITGILLEEQKRDSSISIAGFYDRRIRRIAPALFFVLIPTTFFAILWMLPDELRFFGTALVSSIFFTSNIIFWRDAGYFQQDSETNPLIHTWSLSVEEQFYIFFPLMLIILGRSTQQIKFLVVAALSCMSLMWALYSAELHPEAAFFLLPSRIWELCAGALLAFYRTQLPIKINAKWADLIMVSALVAIALSTALFDYNTPWPGYYALPTIVATCALIAFAGQGTLVGALLRWAPLKWIGLISYSLYLWHQPIFAFARIRFGEPSTELIWLLIGISIALAAFSWKVVEQPFRNRAFLERRTIFSSAIGLGSLLALVGAALYATNGLPQRLPQEVRDIQTGYTKTASFDDCLATPKNRSNPADACETEGNTKVVLWGDSHAGAIAENLSDALAEQNVGLQQLTYISCPPGMAIQVDRNAENCQRRNEKVLDSILTDNDIQIVVLAARWPLYIRGNRFDNLEGGIEPGGPFKVTVGSATKLQSNRRMNAVANDFKATVETLQQAGKIVYIVDPIPEAGWNVPKVIARAAFYGRQSNKTTSYEAYLKRINGTMDWVPPGAHQVEVASLFCDQNENGRCDITRAGEPLYWDDNHVGTAGGSIIAAAIVNGIMEDRSSTR